MSTGSTGGAHYLLVDVPRRNSEYWEEQEKRAREAAAEAEAARRQAEEEAAEKARRWASEYVRHDTGDFDVTASESRPSPSSPLVRFLRCLFGVLFLLMAVACGPPAVAVLLKGVIGQAVVGGILTLFCLFLAWLIFPRKR